MTEPAQDPRRAVVAWLGSENIVAEIKRALPDHVPVDWFMRLAQTAILMNQDLATADRPSLLRELVAVAQLGLVLDPQMGEAWLIIDNTRKVQRRVGYQGLRKLALQSGLVTGLNAQAVYANDTTDIDLGDAPGVKHTVDIRSHDRGPVLGCYAIGKEKATNEPVVEWMSWKDIEAHRDRYSQAGKKGPWGDPLAEIEMGRKTVFRRLCKWLPKSPLLADALAHEDRLDMRTINPDADHEPDPQPRRSALSVIAAANPPQVRPTTAPAAQVRETWGTVPEMHRAGPPTPRQDATAPEPVSASQESAAPSGDAPTGAQSAGVFEVLIDGKSYRRPKDAALALILKIEQSSSPGQILDNYAVVMDNLPRLQANEVLAAVAARGNKDARKSAEAERARAGEAPRRGRPVGSKNRPKERPPEPAGEARSQEPAATPAPGRAEHPLHYEASGAALDDKLHQQFRERAAAHDPETGEIQEPPPWVSDGPPFSGPGVPETWPEVQPEPASGGVYYLTNTSGDVMKAGLTAGEFLASLQILIAEAGNPGIANTWKVRNKTALERLIMTERDNALAKQAVSLQP